MYHAVRLVHCSHVYAALFALTTPRPGFMEEVYLAHFAWSVRRFILLDAILRSTPFRRAPSFPAAFTHLKLLRPFPRQTHYNFAMVKSIMSRSSTYTKVTFHVMTALGARFGPEQRRCSTRESPPPVMRFAAGAPSRRPMPPPHNGPAERRDDRNNGGSLQQKEPRPDDMVGLNNSSLPLRRTIIVHVGPASAGNSPRHAFGSNPRRTILRVRSEATRSTLSAVRWDESHAPSWSRRRSRLQGSHGSAGVSDGSSARCRRSPTSFHFSPAHPPTPRCAPCSTRKSLKPYPPPHAHNSCPHATAACPSSTINASLALAQNVPNDYGLAEVSTMAPGSQGRFPPGAFVSKVHYQDHLPSRTVTTTPGVL